MVKRYNRVILQFIHCFLEGKHKEWDKYVAVLGLALYAAVNMSIGFTANMLHLVHETDMPSDLFLGVAEVNHSNHEAVAYIKELFKTVKETVVKV